MVFNSEQETYDWAVGFGKTLKPGDMVALYGNLGAGKTVISRGVCKGLGFDGNVCSPTYTLLHEYPPPRPFSTTTFTAWNRVRTSAKWAWNPTTWERESPLSNGPNAWKRTQRALPTSSRLKFSPKQAAKSR